MARTISTHLTQVVDDYEKHDVINWVWGGGSGYSQTDDVRKYDYLWYNPEDQQNYWITGDTNYGWDVHAHTDLSWVPPDSPAVGEYCANDTDDYDISSAVSETGGAWLVSEHYQTYHRSAQDTVMLLSGGLAIPGRQILHEITGWAEKIPTGQMAQPSYMYGSAPYPYPSIKVGSLGTLHNDPNWSDVGTLYYVTPAGAGAIDATPTVDKDPFYIFWLGDAPGMLTVHGGVNGGDSDLSEVTPDFCVGQDVGFYATGWPDYVTVSNYQWSLGGNCFNDGTNSVAGETYPTCSTNYFLNADKLTNATVSAWWVSGNYSPPDVYSATVDFTLNFPNGQPPIRTTAFGLFNMWRPKAIISTVMGNVDFGYNYWINYPPLTGQFALHFGNILNFPPTSYLGIKFPNSVSVPVGFSGSSNWIQVINSTERSIQTNDISGRWWKMQASHVVDNPVQFIDIEPTVPYDSPALQPFDGIPPEAYKTYYASDSFTMWLMFTPDGGHIVPLKKINWHWGGTGELSGGDWKLTNPDSGADPNGVDTEDYPSWTNKVSNVNIFYAQ